MLSNKQGVNLIEKATVTNFISHHKKRPLLIMWRIDTTVSGCEAVAWEGENYDWEKMMIEAVCKTHHCYRDKKLCRENILNKLSPVSKQICLIN